MNAAPHLFSAYSQRLHAKGSLALRLIVPPTNHQSDWRYCSIAADSAMRAVCSASHSTLRTPYSPKLAQTCNTLLHALACVMQVTQMLQAVEHLRRRKYKFCNAPPSPTAELTPATCIPCPMQITQMLQTVEHKWQREHKILMVVCNNSSPSQTCHMHPHAMQVMQMLQTVEHLRRRKYKFFNAPPSPTARFHDKAQSRVRAYNRIIPLPLGLANIQVGGLCS